MHHRLVQMMLAEVLARRAGPEAARWVRVEGEHPRWEIKNPRGDGRDYLLSDEAIRTFGPRHLTTLMAGLPPLPEQAWAPPPRKEDHDG
jgi:hypothetical protein